MGSYARLHRGPVDRRHRVAAIFSLTTAIALAAAFLFTPSASFAQRSRAQLDEARHHMEQGQAYFLQGRFSEAAGEFETAYGVQPFSAFLYNAGVAYESGGDLARAVEFFGRYVERDPTASDRAEVEARVEALRGRIAEREAQRAAARAEAERLAAEAAAQGQPPPTEPTVVEEAVPTAPPTQTVIEGLRSLVVVETEPEGATITISHAEGQVVSGSAPLTHTLTRGAYHIVIDHPDYNRYERDFTVEPGVMNRVFVNLSQGEFLGYVRVITNPPGAQVFIDDRAQGARGVTPFEGTVQVGAHRVIVERPGYQPVEREVTLDVGSEETLEIPLERTTFGRVRVIGNIRGAAIFVDGVEVGAVPWEGEVPGGARTIRISSSGMKDWVRTIEVARGQLIPIRARLLPAPSRTGAIVSYTLAVIAAAGGGVLTFLADDLHTTLARERDANALSAGDSRLDLLTGYSFGQYGAYALAVILAGVGTYYLLYDDLPPSEATVLEPRDWALLPLVDPTRGEVGLSVLGRF